MEEPTTDAVKRMKISELRQELHRAELKEAIEEAGGLLGVLRPVVANTKAKLGPTVFAPIAVDGVTTKALINTGSPATIIYLSFVSKSVG